MEKNTEQGADDAYPLRPIRRLEHFGRYTKGADDSSPQRFLDMNNTAAFWRSEGYLVDIIDRPDHFELRVYSEETITVNGNPRYGACSPDTPAAYFGQGAEVVERHPDYWIYVVGERDQEELWGKLWPEGRALSPMGYMHPGSVRHYVENLYGYAPDPNAIPKGGE